LENKEVNIILFGPPGAGKGTQSDKIVKDFKLYKVSTGHLLREEIRNKTNLGSKIKPLIDKGLFVSDEVIDSLIEKILSNKKINNNLIFDGYPRNINQAKKLDFLINKYNQKILCVLNLDVDKNTIIKRIKGRQTCLKCGLIFNEYFNPPTDKNHPCGVNFLEKRSDDNDKTIINRYETYLNETKPILKFYNELNLLQHVNGTLKINEIYSEIRDIIASLET
tara:strand:- start:6390 stop:7055 length:666 start_codon:yes stop_codon:yes gene_type:complete